MQLKDLIHQNRSRRRFQQDYTIERETLVELVDLARLSASGANRQPLKYALCHDPQTNAQVFQLLGWAAYLKDWPGPAEGERPSAYIVILGDTSISPTSGVDHGIAAQSITLGATEKGLGGCIIATIRKEELRRLLGIPAECEILVVIALGKPVETVVIDPVGPEGGIQYWRDEEQVHHVPKRSLEEIIIN
jgi:nitroreductase